MNSTIAFFCPTLELGGAERKTAILANEFYARGHDVVICTADARGVVKNDVGPGIRIVDFATHRVRPALWPLRQFLIENRPRVLICIQCHAGLIGVLANMFSGTRTPVVVVEQSVTLSRLWEKSKLDYYKFRTLIQILYPRARRVIAISRDVRSDLLRHAKIYSARMEVISNPAAIPVIQDRAFDTDKDEIHDGWPPLGNPIIASVGRLVSVKDFPTLLRAFARVRRQRAASLVFIGDGPERGMLEQLARDLGVHRDVYFLGARNQPWRYLKHASVFVMSSRFEGFGNSLVEAMAVGCPVIATDCLGGPSDILEDGKYGPIVPIGDDVAMAAAISKLLAERPDPEILVKRALEYGSPVIATYLDMIDRISGPEGASAR